MEISQIPSFMRGISTKNAIIFRGLLLASLFWSSSSNANDTPITNSVILEKMSFAEQFSYISGIVNGLGYARFQRDKPDEAGLICISNWFYEGDGRFSEIETFMRKFPDHPPAPVIWALVNRECGE